VFLALLPRRVFSGVYIAGLFWNTSLIVSKRKKKKKQHIGAHQCIFWLFSQEVFFFFFDTSNKYLLLRRKKTKLKQLATNIPKETEPGGAKASQEVLAPRNSFNP
jgi:hypothetical protein